MANGKTYHGDGVVSYVRASDGKRVFCARYWYAGKPVVEKVGFDEARARGIAEARKRLIDEDPSYVPPKFKRARRARITFKAFAKEFHEKHGALRRSAETFFEPMERQLVAEFGPKHLDEIQAGRIQQFIAARARRLKPSTVNHSIRFLKSMFARAVEWGYLKGNPAATIRPLKEPPGREVFLSQSESDKLLEVAQKHVRPIVQFALLTGCRRGEILGLTWGQVDLARRTIVLRHTKNGEARALPIGDDLHALLKSIPQHTATDRVFTRYGKPLKSLQGSWEDARDLAGLSHVHFHDLRHTWASRQVAAGTDLYTLRKLGGWKTDAMVQRYAHFAPEYLRTAANRLNGTAGAVPEEEPAQVAGLVAGQSSSTRSMRLAM